MVYHSPKKLIPRLPGISPFKTGVRHSKESFRIQLEDIAYPEKFFTSAYDGVCGAKGGSPSHLQGRDIFFVAT